MSAEIVATTTAARALPTRAAAALSFRLGFVYVQRTSAQFLAIEGCDSFLGFSGVRHFDESESTRTSGITIGDYAYLLDSAVGGKQCPQLCFSCTVRDVANEQFLHFIPFLQTNLTPTSIGERARVLLYCIRPRPIGTLFLNRRPARTRIIQSSHRGNAPGRFLKAPTSRRGLASICVQGGDRLSPRVVSIIFAYHQDLIRPRSPCQIFRLAHQKCNRLRRFSASYLATKFLYVHRIVAHIHQHQAVGIGLPQRARFRDVGGAVYLDASFAHDLGSQIPLVGKGINQQNPPFSAE
jgi:hypothetical protein